MADVPSAYAEFIKEREVAQEARKANFETRSGGIITVSGSLVTLLFGLAALATRAQPTYELPADARGFLNWALTAFVVSALLAILVGAPLFYRTATGSSLDWIIDKVWTEAQSDAVLRIASTRVAIIKQNERLNTVKGILLTGALVFQLLAILFLALALNAILINAPVA